jgi:hypothetical protein
MEFGVRRASDAAWLGENIVSKHWSASSRSATGGEFSWLKNPFLFLCLQFCFPFLLLLLKPEVGSGPRA